MYTPVPMKPTIAEAKARRRIAIFLQSTVAPAVTASDDQNGTRPTPKWRVDELHALFIRLLRATLAASPDAMSSCRYAHTIVRAFAKAPNDPMASRSDPVNSMP